MEITWFTEGLLQKLDNTHSQEISSGLDNILSSINSKHYVQKIGEIRRQFVPRGANKVFEYWRIQDDHSYTFNKGARSELQANIGIWPDGIRLGYGFEPTSAMFGNPDNICRFLNITKELLQNANSVTSRTWEKLSPLYAESCLNTTDLKQEVIQFDELYDWLNTENATWLFWGCFVGIKPDGKTPSILDHKNSLDFIDNFFETTLEFYEEVWRHYKADE
jgi:hypothetical protein